MEIKNYAQIYKDWKGSFEKEDIQKLNEWLRSNGVRIEVEDDADGTVLRVFKE